MMRLVVQLYIDSVWNSGDSEKLQCGQAFLTRVYEEIPVSREGLT
jgi:hypothetical protein